MTSLELQLCDIQGRLFELSVKHGMDSESFIKEFMKSDVAMGLDSKYNRMQWAGEEYLLEELSETREIEIGDTFPVDVMYWIGYTYRYWSIFRKVASKKILRIASAKTMKRNYLMLHAMDPEIAIEDLEEIYRQKHTHK